MERQTSRTVDSRTHGQERQKGRINSTDGRNNGQDKKTTILTITIPTLPSINIIFHQQTDALTEGSIDIKGYKLSGQDGQIDRRGRQ